MRPAPRFLNHAVIPAKAGIQAIRGPRLSSGRRLLGLAVLLSVAGVGSAGAVQVEQLYGVLSKGRALDVASGQAWVQFSGSFAPAARASALLSVGAAAAGTSVGGWTLVNLASGASVALGMSQLKSLPGVQAVEPNHVYRALAQSNDPLAGQQYYLGPEGIDAFGAWDLEQGFTNTVTVAVLDSGILGTHPDLSPKIWAGNNEAFDANTGAMSANNPPTPACSHATEVAGVAAADTNNGVGVAGVSWGAKLLSLKVFNDSSCSSNPDCNASAGCTTTDAAISAAINYAATLPGILRTPVVLNMSLGETGACASVLQTAIAGAIAAGVTVVAAAGNDGGAVNSPANCPGVIPVGATDSSGNIAYFSSNGPELASGGVAAPGYYIETTSWNGTSPIYAQDSGTSFASPMVAGVAALLLSHNPALTPASIQTMIRNSADFNPSIQALNTGAKTFGNQQGAGKLNAHSATILAVRGLTAFPVNDSKPNVFPNPFRPAVDSTAKIVIANHTSVTSIKIYSIDGRLVRTLNGQAWDGTNDGGHPVATGTYIVLVKTDSGSNWGKVAVIR